MYDFSPSPEQERVVERVRALMDELVYPNEGTHRLPPERLRELQARVNRSKRLLADAALHDPDHQVDVVLVLGAQASQ